MNKLILDMRTVDIRSRKFREIFKMFTTLFKDHPNEYNTGLRIRKLNTEPVMWKIQFICEHFEEDDIQGINKLVVFMDEFKNAVCDEGSVYLDKLIGETVAISVLTDKPRRWVKILMMMNERKKNVESDSNTEV